MSQRRDAWPTNCTLKDAHASIFFFFFFFYKLSAFHTQDTFALVSNFEVDHFTCQFLLLSVFLLVLLWKEFIPHSFVVTFHFSHSSGSPPVFLSSWGQLLDSCKHRLFCLHIQHATCLFEWRNPVSSSEAVVCGSVVCGSAFQFHYNKLENLIQQVPKPFILLGDSNSHNTLSECKENDTKENKIENFIYKTNLTLAQRLECSPMARETWVQSQVESYQRL